MTNLFQSCDPDKVRLQRGLFNFSICGLRSIFLFRLSFCSKEQQRPMKAMSMWEQKASQLRRQNRASCEALYEPDESVGLPSALHIRPDMKTHLDRPLVVGHCDGPLLGGHQHHCHKACTSEDAETAAEPPPGSHHPRRHHHHRDRDRTKVNDKTNDNCDGKERRHHVHHSRFKDLDSGRVKEGRGERSRSREGGRRHHHHQTLVDETAGVAVTGEKEHHRHHSHRQSRGGNGTVSSGGAGERRPHRKEGSNRDSDRSTRGNSRANGEKRRHPTHGSRGQSKDGEETSERDKILTNR